MVDPIDRKLSNRPVLKEDMEEFVNRELVPVVEKLRLLAAALLTRVKEGTGDPEGVVSGKTGAIYQRRDGSIGTSLYVKESDDGSETGGNTGWDAK